jgi:prevent-host-death family protein
MATTLNVTEAKAKFSDVVERAVRGEEIIVTKGGKPVVKIVRYEPATGHHRLGLFMGQIEIAEDFDEWPDEIARKLGIID